MRSGRRSRPVRPSRTVVAGGWGSGEGAWREKVFSPSPPFFWPRNLVFLAPENSCKLISRSLAGRDVTRIRAHGTTFRRINRTSHTVLLGVARHTRADIRPVVSPSNFIMSGRFGFAIPKDLRRERLGLFVRARNDAYGRIAARTQTMEFTLFFFTRTSSLFTRYKLNNNAHKRIINLNNVSV